jgi:uncharacterized OsmC-like protein
MRWTMSVKVTQIDGGKFKAEADGFEVLSGRVDEKSEPVGMSPGRLMAVSLGLCSAFHVAAYLRRQKISARGLSLWVDAKNEMNPSRASEFRITIDVGAELNGKQLEGLMEEVGRCYVGNTMRNAPKISYEVRAESS